MLTGSQSFAARWTRGKARQFLPQPAFSVALTDLLTFWLADEDPCIYKGYLHQSVDFIKSSFVKYVFHELHGGKVVGVSPRRLKTSGQHARDFRRTVTPR